MPPATYSILNLMLGGKRGGLEQAALDYAEGLRAGGIHALTVHSPNAWVEAPLASAGVAHEALANFGYWDPFAAKRLRALAARTHASAILCHGNRALGLALTALRGRVPIIAVAHNYSTRRFSRADQCFALTQHLADYLQLGGAKNISLMPNMVRLPPAPQRAAFRAPPVIGSMGRFDRKKGFDVLVDALALLRTRGIAFRAVLGGDGEQAEHLRTRIATHGLGEQITLSGWVKDKAAFFDALDMFVLPSQQEAFGLVLIEAMAHAVPVITSDANGPRSIVHPGVDALLFKRGDVEALADALASLLASPATAAALGHAGRARVEQEYTLAAMAARLQTALAPYISTV